MDFDDLDDAIDARIAEGDIASLEAMGAVKEKAKLKQFIPTEGMTPIPRDHRLPGLAWYHVEQGYSQVGIRIFVFYGPGSKAKELEGTVGSLPPWCEPAVYEWPGHGTRESEPFAENLDALADDAFEAIKPSMEEVKEGGVMEGAPFAFVGQSVGAQIMTLVAKKVLMHFQIEPSVVIVVDRARMDYPLLSEEGRKVLETDPRQVAKAMLAEDFGSWIDVNQLAKDLKYACEEKDGLIHKFECDMMVLKAGKGESIDFAGKTSSKSAVQYRMVTLKIEGSDSSVDIPVEYGTKVEQLKEVIGPIFGFKRTTKVYFEQNGKPLQESEAAEGVLTVSSASGIVDFEHPRYPWPHPSVIIGTGFWGVKMGMQYMIHKNENFLMFDRHEKAGGDAWIMSATKHSRVQTDLGAFNIWFGHEYAYTGDAKDCELGTGFGTNPNTTGGREDGGRAVIGLPFKGPGAPPRGPFTGESGAGSGVDYNPVRAQVIQSMNIAMREYNFVEKARFQTEVTQLKINGKEDARDHSYTLTLKALDKDPKCPKDVQASVLYHFPGAYDINRIIDYPGEKEFGGQIGYGMGNGQGGLFVWDDGNMQGKRAAILGNGAFSVENVRSCCENGAYKVYLVTRRRSLPCPRIPCWFCHQAPKPTPAYMLLDFFKPMYELARIGDPWGYYAINKITPTNVKVTQSSRFGIGDVTFLALAYSIMEYRDGVLDHMTKNTLHLKLNNGKEEKLEDMHHVCKALGLLGDPRVDRLHSMTHRAGNMINGDFRRILIADATGMDATRFTTFSAGPGACSFVKQWYYLHQRPWQFEKAVADGMMKIIPIHKISNTQPDQTVYMTNVQYEMASGTLFGSFFPESFGAYGDEDTMKYCLVHTMHPSDKYLEYVEKDWYRYQAMFKEFNGCENQAEIPYPYTKPQILEWFEWYRRDVQGGGETCWEGPPEEVKKQQLRDYQDLLQYNNRVLTPQLILEALHADRPADADPYSMAMIAEVYPLRQKLMGSKPTSALDFDLEAYDSWRNAVAEEYACDVASIPEASTANVLQHAWGYCLGKIEEKSSHKLLEQA